jgi:glycosyltransferase involved in cell wall biosynthesis
LDIFFFPSVYTFFPLMRPLRAVVVIHDVIAEHYPSLVLGRRSSVLFWRLKLALAIRQAPVILTVSDHSRRGIIDYFGITPERVRTVHEAPDPIFRPLEAPRQLADILPACVLPRDTGRYLLYVGGLSPHKNLHLLLDAFDYLLTQHEFPDLRLLLVGDYQGDAFHSAYESLRQAVHRKRLEDRVCFTGYVPDEVLVDLYNQAEVLILPSLEEGFGLPAFEAAACGTPVVTSSAGPAANLLGPAAWAFPPDDVRALTNGLRDLLNDATRRFDMGNAGRERARSFSWEQAASQTHMVLREVAQC